MVPPAGNPLRIAVIFNLTRPDTMGIYFLKAFRELGHTADHLQTHDAGGLRTGYDLYVRIDDDDYEHRLPRGARPAFYFVSDVFLPHVFRKVAHSAAQFDRIFCPMQPESERLRRMGFRVEWLNAGCEPGLHGDRGLERTCDVAFVGTDGGDPRRFYLQLLRERYPNNRIGGAPHDQLGEIYSRAKIGFSFPIRRECVTMRCFEIMAAGALLVMPELRDDSIERSGFTPGRHLVTFSRPAELFERVDYYLAHREERENIAREGQRMTLSSHTYLHRVKEMLKIYGQITDKKGNG